MVRQARRCLGGQAHHPEPVEGVNRTGWRGHCEQESVTLPYRGRVLRMGSGRFSVLIIFAVVRQAHHPEPAEGMQGGFYGQVES